MDGGGGRGVPCPKACVGRPYVLALANYERFPPRPARRRTGRGVGLPPGGGCRTRPAGQRGPPRLRQPASPSGTEPRAENSCRGSMPSWPTWCSAGGSCASVRPRPSRRSCLSASPSARRRPYTGWWSRSCCVPCPSRDRSASTTSPIRISIATGSRTFATTWTIRPTAGTATSPRASPICWWWESITPPGDHPDRRRAGARSPPIPVRQCVPGVRPASGGRPAARRRRRSHSRRASGGCAQPRVLDPSLRG